MELIAFLIFAAFVMCCVAAMFITINICDYKEKKIKNECNCKTKDE